MHDYPAIREKVIFTPKVTRVLKERADCGEGTIFIGPHLGNFDLGGRAVALQGYKFICPQLSPTERRLCLAEQAAP